MTKSLVLEYLEVSLENSARNVEMFTGQGKLREANQWTAVSGQLISLVKKVKEMQ